MINLNVRVFNIERFAIHDGPGIRTVVFMQGCPLHCPWCSNPESQTFASILIHNEIKCTHCGSCISSCPVGAAIRTDGPSVRFDRGKCNLCGKCVEQCPGGAIRISPDEMKCSDVVSRILRDRDYYAHSGGGVTFSGGEALMQPDALLAMLKACRDEGVHTAVETSAMAPRTVIDSILPYTDLFLADIKHTDADKLHRVTGGDLDLIMGNISAIAACDPGKIRLRLPCIPGFNLERGHFQKAYAFAHSNCIKGIDLLPYHTLGLGKYNQIGEQYGYGQTTPLSRAELEPFASMPEAQGLDIKIL
ncbi:MAG: glycyl-radical enzyme activating protein [Bacteroidales bacterium]|nr:glycyl-radical enzyme activating protein [Bacteroidales bacterium]